MDLAARALWPLASSPERARWAAQAVERYLHMALIIISRAATWPGSEAPFPAQALDLAQQLARWLKRRCSRGHELDRVVVPARTGR